MSLLSTAPPKSQQVSDAIRQEIKDRILSPGDRVYSVRSLADKYQVSIAVIVNAFDILESEGLIVRQGGRGTFVAEEKAEKKSISALFGIMSSQQQGLIDDYFERMNRIFLERKCLPVMINLVDGMAFTNGMNIIRESNPTAFLADLEGRSRPLSQIKEMAGGLPICFVHRWEWDEEPFGPAVLSDFKQIYRKAFEHFLKRGHKRIAIVGHHHEPLEYLERYFIYGANAVGLKYSSYEIEYICEKDFTDCPERLHRVFDCQDYPTAIMALSDYAAMSFSDQLKLIYPEKQLELIGVYNTRWGKRPGREFSSFKFNYDSLWETAIDFFLKNKSHNEVIWVEPELILRGKSL
jgi:DNA-binding transcriptional regulator YhcF (GntR family)